MDNRKETKQFNKKLLAMLLVMLAIFATLLVAKNVVSAVPPEIESLLQTERPNPAYLTYSDLVDYYDILCCQHGTALNGSGRVHLTGSHGGTSFDYDMGQWGDTGYSVGSKIEEHTISTMGNDFSSSSYTHRTFGYYAIAEHHTATPKEAYIIAEMKLELGADNSGSSAELVYNDDGNERTYTGSLTDAIEVQLSTGQTAYTVNQKYVLKTEKGAFFVKLAKDSDGNTYYVYDTYPDGWLKEYGGNFKIKDPKTDKETDCVGVEEDNVYYEHNGELTSGEIELENGMKVPALKSGTLYLVDYDTVVKKDDKYTYALVTNSNSYIQLAWWTTDMGTSHGTVSPSAPNALAKEAEAFEAYILEITGKNSVKDLNYKEQAYKFKEGDKEVTGSVEAPVINYKAEFNEDVDKNGEVNENDKVTVSFDYNKNQYVVGPFSLHYTKSAISVPGRDEVEFASITGVKLKTNIGELEFNKDWNFHFLSDQVRDEDYEYPDPDEIFYIDINYNERLTKIEDFSFEFKYMNAGAELDIYKGYYNNVKWTVEHQDSFTACTDYANCTLTHYHDDGTQCVDPGKTCTSSHNHFSSRKLWLQCASVTPSDSQTLAHALKGARWYETKECSIGFDLKSSSLKIVKKTYDATNPNEAVPVDKTYQFKVSIDGKEVEELTITTKDGVGEANTTRYYWSGDKAPTFTVEEIGVNKNSNNGPWEGTLEDGKVITVDAKNFVEPHRGSLEIDKKLLNSTPALDEEDFHFKVTVSGEFIYEGVKYGSDKQLELNDIIIHGAGSWNSSEFKWFNEDSAPKYKVEEVIPDGSTYELVNGVINNGNSYIEDSEKPTVATATNTTTTNWTVVELDKRMVSDTKPQSGEVFKVKLTVKGPFRYYEKADGTGSSEYIPENEEKVFDVTLDENNNWHWSSGRIEWNKDDVPEYTLSEYEMAEGTEFFSISDEVKTSKLNEFDSKLNPDKTNIIITNSREEKLVGKIKVIKLAETEDLFGKTFNFKVQVKGTFEYNGVKYENTTITLGTDKNVGNEDSRVNITVDSDLKTTDEWESGVFKWSKKDGAPEYTVEEVDLPEGSKFVSISNGQVTYTSTQKISGSLNGITEKANEPDKTGLVVVTCTNKGEARKNAHIVIIKESTDESIDDYNFFFKVTITGTFRYYNKVNDDGTPGYTQYTNETLVLDGSIDDVEAVCGGEDWVSELITWDEDDSAPTYTVEEISIPANIEFVSISNREKTSTSTRIDGVLSEGTENNYITAINKPGPDFVDGSIRIVKKGSEDLKGKIFNFNLTVTGEFDYAGKHYDSSTGPYTLENIEVECNGNPWVSGVFTWNEDGEAPKYTVEEVNIPDDVTFVSISNETEISTDSKSISGNLSLTKPVKIVAINYGGPEPTGSHIEITKEVLNEKLKGTNFYFNVTVESTSPFRYHDLEDATKVTEYKPGEKLEFKNVEVVADEKDWVSGYIEWDEGASVPTYTISEITSAFPDKVKSVSIRNDREIIVKELTNESTENLTITGSLVGDITHIIAVNDANEEAPVKGKIVIEKKALSDLIDGEEFTFSVTITGKFQYGGKSYTKLEIKDIKITANGPSWTSDEISWYEKDGAPRYTVTEETATFSDGTKFVSIRNAYQTNTEPMITGTVEPEFNNWVLAENTFEGNNKGRLQIHKVLLDKDGNQIDGVEFKFNVKITPYKPDGSEDTENIVTETAIVTSGGYWRSNWYTWSKKCKAPKYEVEEIENSEYIVDIKEQTGSLVAQDTENGENGIVTVIAQNTYREVHHARIKVIKDLKLNDKMSKDDVTASFTVLIKVNGRFTYKNKAYNNELLTIKAVISKENNWQVTTDDIYWYGDEVPTFTVEEPTENIPAGWHLIGTSVSSNDNKLKDGATIEAVITNEWTYKEELILTMKLGGKVWDDTNRTDGKPEDTKENGIIDDGEAGISDVKVTIYRALTDKKTGKIVRRLDHVFAYDANNLSTPVDNWTYTDENGNWSFGAISVPAFTENEEYDLEKYCVTYDVEFGYDGQTYEPTEFLAEADNNSKKFINSTTSQRDQYLDNSMAVDNETERNEFNNKFADIQGKEPMDDYGNTVGTTGSGIELNYTSEDMVSVFNGDTSRKVSKLETMKDGKIDDELVMNACTSNENLMFPFYTENTASETTAWHLRDWDKKITDNGEFKITYKFEAVYNYCLSINLGLVEREAADVALEKDLTEALVVVNGKALRYRFNTALDLEDPKNGDLLYKQLQVQDSQIEYKLGLYEGDYYYRANVYTVDNEAKDVITRKLHLNNLSEAEMEIYLTYTIKVYNESDTYDVKIGEIADYYDSSFELVTETEKRYVQTLNDKEVATEIEVGKPSTIEFSDGTVENVTWTEKRILNGSDTKVEGSDGVDYNKIVTSNIGDKKLATGETATITTTFKIAKDAVGKSGVYNTIKLGDKHNLAEITKFTSYYSDKSENRWSKSGQVSGRVDEDSAPDNVNIKSHNEKSYYEDDTDSAPIIKVDLKGSDEMRAISGLVWEDAETKDAGYGQVVGNGLYNKNDGDKTIDNLTVEIYESISVSETGENGETVYKEYQFAWPTDKSLSELGIGNNDMTLSELTGFNQATVTRSGEYSFYNIPAGNYKVRYVYGDKPIETGSDSIKVYNGQDYKTTAYQIGFNNDKVQDGYLDNEWHDITDSSLADLRVNDARDDEARRLYISAKSEMLTYNNSELLARADSKDVDYSQLFGTYDGDNPVTGSGYYMYAETAKINLGVENIKNTENTVASVDGTAMKNSKATGTPKFIYDVKNVDCGIEERSETKLTLDKQIKEIVLTTSDNKVILDAVYDIKYTLKPDGSIASTVTLNKEKSISPEHIASLNRNGGSNQGYRYVIADSEILQGAQIKVQYQLTVFNMSETDRISKALEDLWTKFETTNAAVYSSDSEVLNNEVFNNNDFKAALDKVSTKLYTEDKGRVAYNGSEYESVGYGTYFGSVYYLGSQGVGARPDEVIVKTKVHELLDYVDPDVEFKTEDNVATDQSWTNTEINYLVSNNLIDPSIIQILDKDGNPTGATAKDRTLNSDEKYSIISDKSQQYISEAKNNLILAMSDGSKDKDNGTNPEFIKYLEPYMANNDVEKSTGSISLNVSRTYSSETDAEDIDNLAEIIKVENTAGRRDSRNIAGNANPYTLDGEEPIGIYSVANSGKEKDASATELITLSPPTGLSPEESRLVQLAIVVLISVTIVAVAIVVIKKKVLIKK